MVGMFGETNYGSGLWDSKSTYMALFFSYENELTRFQSNFGVTGVHCDILVWNLVMLQYQNFARILSLQEQS